ncbi:hypothetical protein MRBLWH7_000416 [Microbacterium sp. LWH7-1.2]|uniref:hypothetical protein n=1 Tax=Microbacterium sp. LWH7-1.2 TaxID=3135257 RepID=UPI00313A3C7A
MTTKAGETGLPTRSGSPVSPAEVVWAAHETRPAPIGAGLVVVNIAAGARGSDTSDFRIDVMRLVDSKRDGTGHEAACAAPSKRRRAERHRHQAPSSRDAA